MEGDVNSDPPQLSLCVIARNEETNLPRCLASVAGLVDEIIVTDSGSTDSTITIAEEAGAQVNYFTWRDDFSAAYNHCLDHANGEWVLILDADEELAPESREEVRQLVQREEAFAYNLLRQDFYGQGTKSSSQSEMWHMRLFRRREQVRYIGRIHQQFVTPLSELAKAESRVVYDSAIRLKHYGYLGDYKSRKMDRTIQLLELELKERPDRFYYLVELGRAKLAIGDKSGMQVLHRAAEQLVSGEHPIEARFPSIALLLEEVLACNALPEDFPISFARAEKISKDIFPAAIPLLWQRALKRFQSNEFAESARLLESILVHAERGDYDRLCSFEPEIMGANARLNLGVCYTRLGKFKEAIPCFESLKNHPQQGEAARANLHALRKIRSKR